MEDAELQPGNDLERQAGSGLLRRNKSVDGCRGRSKAMAVRRLRDANPTTSAGDIVPSENVLWIWRSRAIAG